jgi:hypothetical protein
LVDRRQRTVARNAIGLAMMQWMEKNNDVDCDDGEDKNGDDEATSWLGIIF